MEETTHAQEAITITDISGRTVTLDKPAERVLLGEGRDLIALSLLHENPVELIACRPDDFSYLGEETYEVYKAVLFIRYQIC